MDIWLRLNTREHSRHRGWGLALFLLAPALIGASLYLHALVPAAAGSGAAGSLPAAGIVLSVSVLFVGYFSYPRVHNLKVYLLGYLTGTMGLLCFVPRLAPVLPAPPDELLLLFSQANLLLVLCLPSYTTYRATRLVSWAVVAAELAYLLLATSLEAAAVPAFISASRPAAGGWTGAYRWVMVFWPVLVLVVSFLRVRSQFHLGGVVTGLSYFYAVPFLAHAVGEAAGEIVPVIMTGALCYLILGTFVHLFTGMEHRAYYDPLLHILNRNFCSRVIQEQSRLNTAPPFGVAMIDLDHFKQVNDTWGHQTGDQVLVAVARAVQREIIPAGVLCRFGGEELAAFFPRMDTRGILPLVERARKAVQETAVGVNRSKPVSVTVSCGVAHRKKPRQSVMEVIRLADQALYRAKEAGRN
jgi:diguanylate cyclase (GGDEF)-like protein